MQLKTIESGERAKPEITKLQHDVTARMYVRVGEHKVKLYVQSNPYEFQCEAVAWVWHPTELKWNHLYSIPYPRMSTPKGLVYSHMPDLAPNFKSDLDALLAGATAILET